MTDAYRRDGGTIQGPHENRLPLSAQAASDKMERHRHRTGLA
jgi:hypothetical protein